ncbi:MAG: hypothetical protein DRO98_08295, partial [Archaeoglobales archaeon]
MPKVIEVIYEDGVF